MDERQRKWDARYIGLAREVATWSKDPSTKVGAVLVRPNNSVASTGFNGFPPGHDDSPELYADRRYKYANVVHAEINALNFLDGRAEGFTIYTSFPVCPRCMAELRNRGVRRVVSAPMVYGGRDPQWIRHWDRQFEEALQIAREAGIRTDWVGV